MTDAEKDIVERPLWQRVEDIFKKYKYASPAGRMRDELVSLALDRRIEDADTITTLRAEVARLTEERKARHPRQFKYAPTPWSYEGNSDDGYYLLDANGQKIVMLLWPIHPVEETEAVEAEAPLLADFLAFQSAWLTATTLDFFDMERRADKAEAERDAAIARAEKAEAALAKVRPTLKHFQDSLCEGFCSDVPRGFTSYDMENDCGGCKARAVLASLTEGE